MHHSSAPASTIRGKVRVSEQFHTFYPGTPNRNVVGVSGHRGPMNPPHLAKGVGLDLYWASSSSFITFQVSLAGGRAIDDVYE
jgi:hypothetical protein